MNRRFFYPVHRDKRTAYFTAELLVNYYLSIRIATEYIDHFVITVSVCGNGRVHFDLVLE